MWRLWNCRIHCQRMTWTHWLQVTLCVNRNDAGAQQSPQASGDGRGEAPSTSSQAGSSSVPGEAACRTGLLQGLPAGKDETQSPLVVWFCLSWLSFSSALCVFTRVWYTLGVSLAHSWLGGNPGSKFKHSRKELSVLRTEILRQTAPYGLNSAPGGDWQCPPTCCPSGRTGTQEGWWIGPWAPRWGAKFMEF